MSLSEVLARTAELQARLQQLSGPGRPGSPGSAAGTLGAAGADGGAFADQLRSAVTSRAASASSGSSGSSGLSAAAPAAPVLRARAATTGSGAAGLSGDTVVRTAERMAGTPYVWGGESLAEGGFDCSGLVQWTYKKLGIDLPRVASDQGKAGRAVPASEAQPGDLVYFHHTDRSDHIGIYAGGGEWIVAPKTGDVVKRQKVDLSAATSIRRVLPDTGTATASLRAGSAAPTWSAGLPAAGRRYAAMVQDAADAAGVDPRLLAALAWSESGFDAGATSPAGARGLVQLMPATARGLGVSDATDPAQALAGGARYLRQQLDAFGGRADLALAAYNAGPTAVRRAGGVPDYPETTSYVSTVLTRFRTLGGSA